MRLFGVVVLFFSLVAGPLFAWNGDRPLQPVTEIELAERVAGVPSQALGDYLNYLYAGSCFPEALTREGLVFPGFPYDQPAPFDREMALHRAEMLLDNLSAFCLPKRMPEIYLGASFPMPEGMKESASIEFYPLWSGENLRKGGGERSDSVSGIWGVFY